MRKYHLSISRLPWYPTCNQLQGKSSAKKKIAQEYKIPVLSSIKETNIEKEKQKWKRKTDKNKWIKKQFSYQALTS